MLAILILNTDGRLNLSIMERVENNAESGKRKKRFFLYNKWKIEHSKRRQGRGGQTVMKFRVVEGMML